MIYVEREGSEKADRTLIQTTHCANNRDQESLDVKRRRSLVSGYSSTALVLRPS